MITTPRARLTQARSALGAGGTVGVGVGDAHGELVYEVTPNHDLSVDVTVAGKIANLTQCHAVHIPDGATVTIPEFSLDTGGPFNDRAYFRDITITNQVTSSI